MQGLAQELRRRLGLDLFNFDLLHPSPNQPGALYACAPHSALPILVYNSAMQDKDVAGMRGVTAHLTR